MNNTLDTTNLLPIRIGIDLDGVVYNFLDEFRNYAAPKLGLMPQDLPDSDNWFFSRDWGMTDEEYADMLHFGVTKDDLFSKGEVYPGAVEALKKLQEANFEIVIITARDLDGTTDTIKFVRERTELWLLENKVPYDELIIDNCKFVHDINVLVDDGIHNVSNFVQTGRPAYVFDRPWNQNFVYDRVMDWDHLVSEMLDLRQKLDSLVARDLTS